jgi:hypothetical protein
MARYTLFVLLVIGSAATAVAAIAPENSISATARNITVIEKNQVFPVLGPIIVEDCASEDCAGEEV